MTLKKIIGGKKSMKGRVHAVLGRYFRENREERSRKKERREKGGKREREKWRDKERKEREREKK